MSEIDYLGANGGQLAAAFGSGCVATWAFLNGFFWRGIRKALDRRIADLEADNEKCEERTLRLETLLWMHGPQQLRGQLQAVVSEAHIEMRRALGDLPPDPTVPTKRGGQS